MCYWISNYTSTFLYVYINHFVCRLYGTGSARFFWRTSVYDFCIRATGNWNWSTTTGWTCKIQSNHMDGVIWWRRCDSWTCRIHWLQIRILKMSSCFIQTKHIYNNNDFCAPQNLQSVIQNVWTSKRIFIFNCDVDLMSAVISKCQSNGFSFLVGWFFLYFLMHHTTIWLVFVWFSFNSFSVYLDVFFFSTIFCIKIR